MILLMTEILQRLRIGRCILVCFPCYFQGLAVLSHIVKVFVAINVI